MGAFVAIDHCMGDQRRSASVARGPHHAAPQAGRSLESKAHAGTDLSSLRLCITAGTALPKHTFDAFWARSGLPVRQLYGCSEGGALALNTAPDPVPVWDSVERGIGDTRFRILSPDADGIGEIAVKSSNLMRG